MFVYFKWSTTWLYYILGDIVVYISLFIMPLFPSSLTWIHNSGLTHPFLNLRYSYHMHWKTDIHSNFINISYTYLSLKGFCCLLLLGEIFNLNIQHSKTCNQHHIYTIFEQIPIFHASYLVTCGSNSVR